MQSFKNTIKNIEREIDHLNDQVAYYDLRIAQAVKHNNRDMIESLVAKQQAFEVKLCSVRAQLDAIGVKQVEEEKLRKRSAF
jgi:hypothetical protein